MLVCLNESTRQFHKLNNPLPSSFRILINWLTFTKGFENATCVIHLQIIFMSWYSSISIGCGSKQGWQYGMACVLMAMTHVLWQNYLVDRDTEDIEDTAGQEPVAKAKTVFAHADVTVTCLMFHAVSRWNSTGSLQGHQLPNLVLETWMQKRNAGSPNADASDVYTSRL